jgi:hypothetical protein
MSRLKQHTKNLKLVTIFLLFFTQLVFGQKTIRGKIIDQATKEPLVYGTVFINNTTKATTSDEFGNFVINDIGLEKFDIVIRYVGYESFTKEINLIGQRTLDITIQLKLMQNLMGDLEVTSKKDKDWQKQYQQFQKLFFGRSEFAQKCKIENPYEIEFNNDVNGFKAKSERPLNITNNALGYKLTLKLRDFWVGANDYRIFSDIFFEELVPNNLKQKKIWETNRKIAYNYSIKNIVQSMLRKDPNIEYYVRDTDKEESIVASAPEMSSLKIDYLNIDSLSDGTFRIDTPKNLEIQLTNLKLLDKLFFKYDNSVNWLTTENGYINSDKDGNILNPYELFWYGDVNHYKISGVLPLDFQLAEPVVSKKRKYTNYNEEKEFVKSEDSKTQGNRFIIRNESISSHLNQSYYYPEETIWFSLKMNKISPESVSSKVIYVDIFSEEKRNVFSGTFLFKNGSSSGSWKIPKNMEEGKYVLRAYTNWMRNFDDSTFSYTEFKILPLGKVSNVNIVSTYLENKYLKVEKSKFGKSDSIHIEIKECMNCIFSTTVTKANFLNPQLENLHKNKPLTKIVDSLPSYPMEDEGRLIYGNLANKTKGSVWFFNNNLSDFKVIETNDSGKFNLILPNTYDSTVFYLKAYNEKNKIVKNITLAEKPTIPLKYKFSSENNIDQIVESPVLNKVYNFEDMDQLVTLDEVIVKAKKLENRLLAKDRKLFGRPPSQSFISQDLKKSTGPNIIYSLTTLVPGIRIVHDVERHTTNVMLLNKPVSVGIIYDGMEVTPETIGHLSADIIGVLDFYRSFPPLIVIYSKSYLNIEVEQKNTRDKNEAKLFITKGINTTKNFYLPSKIKHRERLDFLENRNTIYWNPNIETGDTGRAIVSFEALAIPGEYVIELAGKDEKGKVISERKVIEIR